MARLPLIKGIVRTAFSVTDGALTLAGRLRESGLRAPRHQPIDLAMRAASAVVGRLEASPPPAATTATQQILLGAAAAQLRARAGSILPSSEGERSGSEAALGELIARTLALVDDALAGGPELASRAGAAPAERPQAEVSESEPRQLGP